MHRIAEVTFGVVFTLVSLGSAGQAQAQRRNPFAIRCESDNMVPGAHYGRNAWAEKCGYVDAQMQAMMDSRGNYVTFAEKVAPMDAGAGCEGFENMSIMGWCAALGCYTPTQRVAFGPHGYTPVGEAGSRDLDTISGFAQSWLLGDTIELVDEEIANYTVGDQTNDVLVVVTETGRRVEVTDKHPLVNADGQVVQASTLVAAESKLLTVDGPERVKSIDRMPYIGKVWNVEPKSTRTLANLHLAEGFVAGSVRYQNEWADDDYRRALRNHVDLTDF